MNVLVKVNAGAKLMKSKFSILGIDALNLEVEK